MASEKDIFDVSGPTHLTSVDWYDVLTNCMMPLDSNSGYPVYF